MQESQDTYALLLPAGEDGPFTREELCSLLRLGKARADDHVRVLTSGLVTLIDKVIPEAQELMKSAPPISERIKRTSQRIKVVVPQSGDPEVLPQANPVDGTPEIATPGPATEIAQAVKNGLRRTSEFIAVANSEMADQVNAAAPPDHRLRGVKILVPLLAIPLSLWWIWGQLHPTYNKAYPLEGIAWTTLTTQEKPALPNVRIVIAGDTLKITTDGSTSIHQMVMLSAIEGITFNLTPDHPLLGGTFLLEESRNDSPLMMITADRKRIPLRQE